MNKKVRDISQIRFGGERRYKGDSSAKNTLYKSYVNGAKRRGLPFELSPNEIIALCSSRCYYCNVEPQQVKKACRSTFIYNGIDRVKNEKTEGYTMENCVPCCKVCNSAKGTLTPSEFLSWRQRIAAHLEPKFSVSSYIDFNPDGYAQTGG